MYVVPYYSSARGWKILIGIWKRVQYSDTIVHISIVQQNPEPSAPPFDEDVVAKALAEYNYPADEDMNLFLAKTANGIQLEWEQDGIRYRAVESTKKTHSKPFYIFWRPIVGRLDFGVSELVG